MLRSSGTHPRVDVPGIAKCGEQDKPSPERDADREACAQWQREWIRKNRITIDTLGDILELTYGAAQAKYEGRRLFTIQDIRRFPAKHRRELVFAFLLWCDSNDVSALSKHG